MMKLNYLPIFTGLLLSAGSAFAERNVSYDYADVVESTAIVKNIRVSTPREECWDETVRYDNSRSNNVSTVLGAVVGGALGNAVGHKKSNQRVGAVVGAVLGGTIGSAVGKERRVSERTEEVCRVIHDYREEERIVGYHVQYQYNDVVYTTRLDEDPGQTIKLRLSVSPVI